MTDSNSQSNTLEAVDSFDVIKGEFTPAEAKEIIGYLIRKKIQFHQGRNFSKEIRQGMQDEDSIQRIQQLRQMRNEIDKLIENAENDGKKLKVNATIKIESI